MTEENSICRRGRALPVAGVMAAFLTASCNDEDLMGGIDRGGAPVPSAVVSSGPVTGFGSVVVNGESYDTGNAEFVIGGAPGSEADLQIGQIIIVRGTIESGGARTALRVELDEQLRGAVEAVDPDAGRLTVLGQTVRVDESTSFDRDFSPRTLEGIQSDDHIRVSALFDADGVLVASRLSPDDAAADARVHGFLSDVDTAAKTFRINALIVDYSSATLEGFPGGAPQDGDFVEVEGARNPSGQLVAARLALETLSLRGGDDDDLEAELEGYITRFVSLGDFDVAGQPVRTDAQTTFEGGSAETLALNIKVEVDGTIGADGILHARLVEIEKAGILAIVADVQDVNAAAGTLTMLGILVRVDDDTRLEDQSDDGQRLFDLGDINVGNRLEVHGFEEPEGSHEVAATLLEREDDDDGVELKGFVETLADPEFTILGVTILTTPDTEFDDVSRSEFFDEAAGRLVEVEGELSGSVLIAEEVEFEDDD